MAIITNDPDAPALAPAAVITPPPLTLPPLSLPQIARTLIDEENGVDPTGGRWQAGVTFRPEPLGHAGGYSPCADEALPFIETCDPDAAPPLYRPFWAVYSSETPLSSARAAELGPRAERGLRAHEAWRVENEWWTGALQPGNQYLARPDGLIGAAGWGLVIDPADGSVDTVPAAVSIKEGIALLEEAIALADIGIGVIHLTPYMLQRVSNSGGVSFRFENGRLVTQNGNWVIPGNGYAGTGPDGSGGPAEHSQWAYATDMVYTLRGTVTTGPESYPVDFAGGLASSDFMQSLINAGTEIPMASRWFASRPWAVLTNGGLRAGIKIDVTAS